MGKITGFLEYDRFVPEKRKPEDRLKDWAEIKGHFTEEELKIQAARCMNCGIPFCQSGVSLNGMTAGCPLHNLIPQWNDLIYNGRWEDAFKRLERTNPFPEFTSRVCPAPCEGSCTEGHVTEPVTICNIEYEIIERAFSQGWVKPEILAATGKKVAVVGAGPAGMSAAWNLAILGHDVTVYERQEAAGGLLMYGIPNMKLDKSVVERRINLMKEIGIKFVLGTEVGKDIPTQDLINNFDAVLLALGATDGRKLMVPGNDAKGVVMAVDYLKANTRNILEDEYVLSDEMNASGKNVVVIGGGDTGTDCVGTSIRQGALTVCQFEITGKLADDRNPVSNPWPEWPKVLKTDYGQEEAIHTFGDDPRIYEISTTEILKNEDGSVKGLNTVKVEWKCDGGRFMPVPVEGTEKFYPAELVLISMGFVGPEKTIINELSLDTDNRGNILTQEATYETSRNGVYACGDARRGQSLVVWGFAEGKQAALSIDKYLFVDKIDK